MHRLFSAALCVLFLAACSGGGTAASTPPHASTPAVSAADSQAIAPPDGDARRPLAATGCSGVGTASFVGGSEGNVAGANYDAVLGGYGNQVCDVIAAIGGGYDNIIGGGGDTRESWIGGGYQNTISGEASGSVIGGGDYNASTGAFASVGGGYSNTVSAEWATVAGGTTNIASGNASNVAGGAHNTASGAHATVLGGSQNTASGNQSLAAGYNSNAATTGAFVWSDDSGTTGLTSTVANQFLARASGGVTFWTNAGSTVGATLAPGSGAWASASDRNMKTNIAALDDAQVLDRVGRLPVSTWSYVTEHGVRHVGPMAQDFYAAFGVGADDRHITSIDEDGVALAAIKALRDQNAVLRAQQQMMRTTLAATNRELARQQALRATPTAAERDMLTKQIAMEREISRLTTLVGSLKHETSR